MKKLFGSLTFFALALSLAVCMAYAADVTSDLAGYWPLDGNAKDLSGNGNDGEAVGNPEWVDGRRGQAVQLAGVVNDDTQHVYIPGFDLTTDTITFVAWINGWKNDTWTGIIVSRGTNDLGIGFGDGDALHYTWSGNSTWQWHDGPVIPEDTWAMVAAALEPTIATAYLYTDADGLQSSSNQTDHPAETVDNVRIGWDECCGGARWFVGMMDEVMIYNRTLSEDDILELAISGPAAVELSGKLTTTWAEIKQ